MVVRYGMITSLALPLSMMNECNPPEDDPTPTPAPVDADGDGWTVEEGNCDDMNWLINPEGTEVCDPEGKDEDCDGFINDNDKWGLVSLYTGNIVYYDVDLQTAVDWIQYSGSSIYVCGGEHESVVIDGQLNLSVIPLARAVINGSVTITDTEDLLFGDPDHVDTMYYGFEIKGLHVEQSNGIELPTLTLYGDVYISL